MKNKVLIKLIVPELDRTFDLFIPVNELVWKVKKMIVKSVGELSGSALNLNKDFILLDKLTSYIYPDNVSVLETNIRNASELVLLSYIAS